MKEANRVLEILKSVFGRRTRVALPDETRAAMSRAMLALRDEVDEYNTTVDSAGFRLVAACNFQVMRKSRCERDITIKLEGPCPHCGPASGDQPPGSAAGRRAAGQLL